MRILFPLLLCGLVIGGCDCDDDDTDTDGTDTDTTDTPGTDMGGSDMSMPPTDGGGMDGNVPADMPPMSDMLPDGTILLDGGRVCHTASCQGLINRCGNCMDDDGDGFIDSDDPDCLGACDNNESGLYHGIPGGDTPQCGLDCYYDKDQGSGSPGGGGGNDGCFSDARCDPLGPDLNPNCQPEDPPPPPANCPDMQSEGCLAFCEPLTPNGCDCFGCCEIAGNTVFVGTLDAAGVATCTLELAIAGDLEACRPCTQRESCNNPCGECELCLGRDPDELPEHCFPPPPSDMGMDDMGPLPDGATPSDMFTPDPRCPDGRQPCGLEGDPQCPANHFCLTGCCTLFG